MARFRDHQKALALRKQGNSYSQIKKILGVNKSTLSGWLKDYPLSKERVRQLRDWNEQRIEKFRETMKKKKEKRLNSFYEKQKGIIFPIKKRELFLAGLFLYWGEGTKTSTAYLSVSNTNPSVLNFFIYWLKGVFGVPKEKLRIGLHLYSDMDIQEKINFWAKTLNVSKKQFTKPYIKNNSSIKINHKGVFGHGTCNVSIGNARLSEEILMAIKAISDKYKGSGQ